MEFGIYHEFPSLNGQPDTVAFEHAFDLVEAADGWGLDIMWLAELHFDPERSLLSAPLCVASAAVARTKRIKIGIGVQVLPLGNPLRIAEETATVDQISHGRLILGVGRSGVARTYEAYNIPYAESRGRFAETLDIIEKAWATPTLSFEGKYFRFKDVTVTPRPFKAEGPPIYIAASSTDTYATIGKRGKPILMGVKFEDARELTPYIQAYRDAWKAAGHPGHGHVTMRTPGFVAATEGAAREQAEESLLHYYRAQAALQTDSARRPGVDAPEKKLAAAAQLNAMTFEQAQRGSILIGTPDRVAGKLGALQKDIGLDAVMIEMNTGGLIPHEREKEALRLLCQEVMPRFR